MRSALWLSALTVGLMGFSDCSEPPAPEPVGLGVPPGAGPFISDEPVWSVGGEELGLAETVCPGTSLAVADLNGDGYPELAASAGPCSWSPVAPGHLLVFPGEPKHFSRQPLVIPMDWRTTVTRSLGRSMKVASGDVNGDGYADLLVSSLAGVQVFTGGPDLQAALAAPAYRVPYNTTYRSAVFADVNGDALDDIVITLYPYTYVLASTPGAATPFTFRGGGFTLGFDVANAGDVTGDGADDLLAIVTAEEETRLLPGCRAPDPQQPCAMPFSLQPAWVMPGKIPALMPDLNADGRPEFLRAEFISGRAWMHLAEPETGHPSPTPVWGALGDPLFPLFGHSLIPLGDVDGDGVSTDFGVAAQGKLYAFFPGQGLSSELSPGWAWPRSGNAGTDSIDARFITAIAGGDLDHDGYADVVLSAPPYFDSPTGTRGRISVYAGGKLPPSPGPYLPEPVLCAGQAPAGSDKPELVLDGDLLARSLYIQNQFFEENSCERMEGCVAGAGNRRLLRFGVSIVNVGAVTALVPGPTQAPELYQFDTCHGHHHLTNFATYALHDSRDGVVAVGRKQGFEMIDFQPYCMDAAPPANHAPSQGISPGWADIYAADLPCQWLDITDVPDGVYTLRVGIDSANVVEEDDTAPNSADVTVRIKGDEVKVLN